MAKPQRINFRFSCFGKMFIAGSEAKGFLEVCLASEAKDIKIKVGIIGKIIFPCDENSNGNAMDHVIYNSEERIFTAGDICPDLEEQLLEYSIPLVENLPPSISLDEGSIEYQLHATMEEEFNDGKTQVVSTHANISVATLMNCNMIPKGDKNKRCNETSVSSCLCIANDDSLSLLEISPRVYVPGDCVKINASVYNPNNFPWSYVQVALVQKIKFKCEDRVVRAQRVVSETKRGCLMPRSHQTWRNEYLRIPPLPPTTYHKFVTVSYKLKLIPGVQSTASLTSSTLLMLPLFIGNIPLDHSLEYFNKLNPCETFGNKLLPIPAPYSEFAGVENCILSSNRSKFVPAYISYTTEHAMESIDLS